MHSTGFNSFLLLFILIQLVFIRGRTNAIQFDRWFAPFNNSNKVYELCTDEMDRIILRPTDNQDWVRFYMEKWVVCYPDFHNYVKPKFKPLVWLMRELRFCEIHQIIQYGKSPSSWHRQFQRTLLKYSYVLLCGKAHLIPESEQLNLHIYSNIFRILYEKDNPERRHICDKITAIYADLYGRCYVSAVEKRQRQIEDRCLGDKTPFIKTPAFFQRFSRYCDTLQDFVGNNSLATRGLGRALANDVIFLNLLNANLVSNVNEDSELLSLVLKTRLLLQHFSLAAVKLWHQLEAIGNCRLEMSLASANETANDDLPDTDEHDDFGSLVQKKCCVYNNSYICELQNENRFKSLAEQAWRAFYIEFVLLAVVFFNTILLTVLLFKTKKQLSTATVLFVCNIVFSNVLFLASFVCLFSDLLDDEQYGPVNEEHAKKSPELIVAETLRTHLFAKSEFVQHLVQETLFSLAQNGSLTGLIHLLVLVLVVINRSMSGKSIHLSRVSVVSVFASVWLFLIITHVVFSTLQNNAIKYLDELFVTLSKGRQYLQCDGKHVNSDYEEIAVHCDRTAIFHAFGAYLLRGHTLFTCLFLSLSIIIFTVTLTYHWRVRRQHDFLHSGLRKVESLTSANAQSQSEQSPHRRREMLFHTLLLSIGAFFISVMGQTYVELAVFWMDDREQLASLARWYQLSRLAAFVDPVLNPLIVVIRTPALRRQLRAEWTSVRRSSERSRDSVRKRRSQSSEESTGRLTLLRPSASRVIRSSFRSMTPTRYRTGSQRNEAEICLKGKGRSTVMQTSLKRRSLDSQHPSIV